MTETDIALIKLRLTNLETSSASILTTLEKHTEIEEDKFGKIFSSLGNINVEIAKLDTKAKLSGAAWGGLASLLITVISGVIFYQVTKGA